MRFAVNVNVKFTAMEEIITGFLMGKILFTVLNVPRVLAWTVPNVNLIKLKGIN